MIPVDEDIQNGMFYGRPESSTDALTDPAVVKFLCCTGGSVG